MNIKELSIGDWVRMAGENFQIYNLTLAGDVYGYRRTDNSFAGEEYYDGEIGDVQPIPLTPEILEKNGFEKLGLSERRWENKEMCIAAVRDTEGKYWVVCEADYNRIAPFDVNVYSVHELQHALRLAGIEKEIEL